MASTTNEEPAARTGWWRFGVPAALAAACLTVVPILARDALAADALDALRRATTAARLAAIKPEAPPAKPMLDAAIARGERAARLDPANPQLAILLGQANLHLAMVSHDAAARDALRRRADEWFLRARRESAVTRGLPEPLPRVTK